MEDQNVPVRGNEPEMAISPPIVDDTLPVPTPEVDTVPVLPPEVEPVLVAGEAAYIGRRWNGQPLYACLTCSFDTLDLAAMLDHQRIVHALAPVAAPEPAPVEYDRFGVQVEA